MSLDRDSRTNRPLTPRELANQVSSLRTVGGIYNYVVDCVEYDNTPTLTTQTTNPAALAAETETESMMHEQTHIDCCRCCKECNPPERRTEAQLRATFGKPLFELPEGDTK